MALSGIGVRWASSRWAIRSASDGVQAVAALRNAGLKTILITGDNEPAAQWVAREVGKWRMTEDRALR